MNAVGVPASSPRLAQKNPPPVGAGEFLRPLTKVIVNSRSLTTPGFPFPYITGLADRITCPVYAGCNGLTRKRLAFITMRPTVIYRIIFAITVENFIIIIMITFSANALSFFAVLQFLALFLFGATIIIGVKLTAGAIIQLAIPIVTNIRAAPHRKKIFIFAGMRCMFISRTDVFM